MRKKIILKNPWWVVFGSFLGLIVGNVTIYQFSFSVLIKPITAEFGWNRGMTSAAVLVASIFAAIATPLVGWLIDRTGTRRVTLVSIVLFSGAIMSMSLVPGSFAAFMVMYAVLGVFSAAQAPLPYVKAITAAIDGKRGLALGIAMTGVGLGTALMPRLAQHILQVAGWRGAFVGLGATVLIVAFPAAFLFLRDSAAAVTASSASRLPGLSAHDAVKSKVFWTLAIVFISLPIVASGTIVHLVPLLTDRGVANSTAVSVFQSIGACLIVGRLLSGYLLDKFFAPYVAAAFVLMPAVGLILLATTTNEHMAFLGSALVGLGLGAEVDLIGYLQSRYLGLRAFGQIYGYLFAILTLGGGIGPFIMGATFDHAGSYQPALIGFIALLAVAILLLSTLKREYPYPVQEAQPVDIGEVGWRGPYV